MTKYEIKKNYAEFKNEKDIMAGCTIGNQNEPETFASYTTLEEAKEHLAILETDVCEFSTPNGTMYGVIEFYIEQNEYDEYGEWMNGGDIWAFSKIK